MVRTIRYQVHLMFGKCAAYKLCTSSCHSFRTRVGTAIEAKAAQMTSPSQLCHEMVALPRTSRPRTDSAYGLIHYQLYPTRRTFYCRHQGSCRDSVASTTNRWAGQGRPCPKPNELNGEGLVSRDLSHLPMLVFRLQDLKYRTHQLSGWSLRYLQETSPH